MMPVNAELLLPPSELASCVSAAIFRDTTGVQLSERDRLNYFPATPLYAVTRVFTGELHMATGLTDIAGLRAQPAMRRLSAVPPQTLPTCSWSRGGIRAITLAIYPDAWMTLGGSRDGATVPRAFKDALLQDVTCLPVFWAACCDRLAPHWTALRQGNRGWHGSHRVADWARHVITSAALSGTGRSLRSMERRLRRLTGHSRQSIDFFAKVEDLHARRVTSPDTPLAEMAVAADFSDQSHMGRAVKRVTGFSPGQLNRMIDTEEAFWCYRLLGERF